MEVAGALLTRCFALATSAPHCVCPQSSLPPTTAMCVA